MRAAANYVRRIAVVPSFNPASGGEYQYSQSILHALDRLAADSQVILYVRPVDRPLFGEMKLSSRFLLRPFDPLGMNRLLSRGKSIVRSLPFGPLMQDLYNGLRRYRGGAIHHPFPSKSSYGRYFLECGARWVLFTAPTAMAFECGGPFAVPIHDLQHRLQSQFPEVSARGEFERREYMFGNAARYARMILVDSEAGKRDALECYGSLGLAEDRIGVLSFRI